MNQKETINKLINNYKKKKQDFEDKELETNIKKEEYIQEYYRLNTEYYHLKLNVKKYHPDVEDYIEIDRLNPKYIKKNPIYYT